MTKALTAAHPDAPVAWMLRAFAEAARRLGDCDGLERLMPRLKSAIHPTIDPDVIAKLEVCRPNVTATDPPRLPLQPP